MLNFRIMPDDGMVVAVVSEDTNERYEIVDMGDHFTLSVILNSDPRYAMRYETLQEAMAAADNHYGKLENG